VRVTAVVIAGGKHRSHVPAPFATRKPHGRPCGCGYEVSVMFCGRSRFEGQALLSGDDPQLGPQRHEGLRRLGPCRPVSPLYSQPRPEISSPPCRHSASEEPIDGVSSVNMPLPRGRRRRHEERPGPLGDRRLSSGRRDPWTRAPSPSQCRVAPATSTAAPCEFSRRSPHGFPARRGGQSGGRPALRRRRGRWLARARASRTAHTSSRPDAASPSRQWSRLPCRRAHIGRDNGGEPMLQAAYEAASVCADGGGVGGEAHRRYEESNGETDGGHGHHRPDAP
jgi:hypothetical protein